MISCILGRLQTAASWLWGAQQGTDGKSCPVFCAYAASLLHEVLKQRQGSSKKSTKAPKTEKVPVNWSDCTEKKIVNKCPELSHVPQIVVWSVYAKTRSCKRLTINFELKGIYACMHAHIIKLKKINRGQNSWTSITTALYDAFAKMYLTEWNVPDLLFQKQPRGSLEYCALLILLFPSELWLPWAVRCKMERK